MSDPVETGTSEIAARIDGAEIFQFPIKARVLMAGGQNDRAASSGAAASPQTDSMGFSEPAPAPPDGADEKNAPNGDDFSRRQQGGSGGNADLECAFLPLTDLGNAERFVRRYRDKFMFCAVMGWLFWDGKRWALNGAEAKVMRAAHDTVRAIQDEAKALIEAGQDFDCGSDKLPLLYSDKLKKWGRSSESNGKILPVLRHALPYLEISPAALDADPMRLNVQNGTLRFDRTLPALVELMPHRPEDLITKICPVDYDSYAECPLFDAFINEVQPDTQVRRFLDQWGGLSLTGDVGEQILTFHYGTGRNGKGVWVEALSYVAGDYAASVAIETFLTQGTGKKGGDATPDLAKLPGVRMLTTSEPEKGSKMNEGLIKKVTGGDPIDARFLNKEFFAFKPQFKLTMQGNYRPKINGTDEGIWNRFRLVPWPVFIPPEKRDKKLSAKLRLEGAGILARLVEGLKDWMREGLVLPENVRQASETFREESDPLGRFLADCTRQALGKRVPAVELFALFGAWAKATGETEWTMKGFGAALRDRGLAAQKSSTIYWLDIEMTRHVADYVDEHGKPRRETQEHFAGGYDEL